jgi:hypothetical protein
MSQVFIHTRTLHALDCAIASNTGLIHSHGSSDICDMLVDDLVASVHWCLKHRCDETRNDATLQVALELGLQSAWQQQQDVELIAQEVKAFMERYVHAHQQRVLPVLTVFHKAGFGALGNKVYKVGRRQVAQVLGLQCDEVRSERLRRSWTRVKHRRAKRASNGDSAVEGTRAKLREATRRVGHRSSTSGEGGRDRGAGTRNLLASTVKRKSGIVGLRPSTTADVAGGTPGDQSVALGTALLQKDSSLRLQGWDGSGGTPRTVQGGMYHELSVLVPEFEVSVPLDEDKEDEEEGWEGAPPQQRFFAEQPTFSERIGSRMVAAGALQPVSGHRLVHSNKQPCQAAPWGPRPLSVRGLQPLRVCFSSLPVRNGRQLQVHLPLRTKLHLCWR